MGDHRPASAGEIRRGRPRTTDLRAVVNAVFYIAQTDCQWRLLPKDFSPFTTVQGYFYQWRDEGRWAINHDLVMRMEIPTVRLRTPPEQHYGCTRNLG